MSPASADKRFRAQLKERNVMVAGLREHDFDGFNIALVDVWIENDAQERGLDRAAGLADLEAKVVSALEAWNVEQAA